MKKICLIGPVDKRAISYPLIKTLIFLGKTLIVTDDGIYRRFDEEYNNRFSFENSEFIVTHNIKDEEVKREIEQISSSFDYVLYITTNELPEDCDKIVNCKGVDKGFVSRSVEKEIEKSEHIEVYVTFSKLSDSSLLKIEPNKSTLSYLAECEDKKEFLSTKDASFATMLSKFFETELDLQKSTIKGLLLRKG